eukprot:CAMPEP_0197193244 /NCGR_PEP_ID=MMETSP1423-20130617/26763_1 /TAXON_ID=476441 /ORGANISM="Pseudo-nitzschia heimii, Strain UNC1101" /LENGTH=1308 /DNA_ID=CAMNT_0042646379 /DNA_START=291 /DNA_END=4217 /DNA_ORIENTATION=-
MGFDVSQITSDPTHYSSFICPLDNNLVHLDSAVVVPSAKELVFNRSCLVDNARKCVEEGLSTVRIPSCQLDLKLRTEPKDNQNGSRRGLRVYINETTWIEAGLLQELQPLAYQCLRMVQVRCKQPGGSGDWVGNYGDIPSHLLAENDRYSDTPALSGQGSSTASSMIPKGSGAPIPKRNLSGGSGGEAASTLYDAGLEAGERVNVGVTTRGTGAHHKRMVDDAVVIKRLPPKSPGGSLLDNTAAPGTDPIDVVPDDNYDPEELKRAMERCDKLKKQANAKFNRADVDGARVLYSEGLALLSDFPLHIGQNANDREERDENAIVQDDMIQKVREMVASLYSNRAVTFYRERILQPSVDDCNKSLELDPKSEKTYIRKWRALDAMGERHQALACLEDGVKQLPKSEKLMDQLRKSLNPLAEGSGSGSGVKPSDRSIASAFNDKLTVASGKFGQHEMDISVAGDPNHTILDRAERLKKQANAKFNKGDIDAARALYTDALGCIPAQGFYSRGVKSLLSELYSNRAVTHYRNREYQESLEDCEQSIDKNPEAEKSYIRKARALVGLERHMDASKCLQEAHKLFPASKKIKEELNKIGDQRDANSFGGQGHTASSNDSVDHNISVGSLSNFYPASHGGSRAAETLTTGREELTYAEDIELSDRMKRNANAKFNRGDVAGARLLYTEAMGCLPNDRENEIVRACLASLYANRAVTYYREQEFVQSIRDCDHSIELDPKGEKPYSRKARALASMERYEEAIKTLEEGKRQVPGSDKLEDELTKIRQELGAAVEEGRQPARDDGSETEMGMHASSVADNNESSNSFFVSPGNAAMDSVPEGKSQEFDLPAKIDPEEFERAEKLKKQANAKLNKGDVAGARVLYGEGLACMPPGFEKTPDGRELAANLYANRAVTYFREKKFSETVNDCNKAVEFDPKHEKSYIRKWRALMALGAFDDALRCLESALKELPESDRLNEELANATEERNLLNTVNQMIAKQEYQEAHDILEDIVKTSDNVTLWLASARTDSCLGNTDSALDRVEKVLMFNPKHAEALRVRGFATFLSGDMEHGINLLKESLEGDIEDTANRTASGMLQGCQQKINIFHKGQARVKRGRYREAVELFTTVLKEGIEIPRQSPLYGILLTERAEANLLSEQHEAALEDCAEAISLKQDNLPAWTVKIEVYYALGRLQEARDELGIARKTWGARNETIEDAYKKTDFELRLRKVDNEVRFLVGTVESRKPYDDEDGILHMNHSQRQWNADDSALRPPSPLKRSSDVNGHANKRAQSRGKREGGFKFFKSSSRERGGGRSGN